MTYAELIRNLPASVSIMEVGPRDGLQNERTLVETKKKIEFIESLVDAGIKRIEITAFVSPRWIPPLADHYEVACGIKKKPGVSYAALVPNVQGYERALLTGNIDEISLVVAASESHNLKNLNGSTKDILQRYAELSTRAQSDKVPFRGYISCAFGCPYEGKIAVSQVINLAQSLLDLGAYEISIGDTIGIAHPLQTMSLLEQLLTIVAKEKIALHMHDTRGTALANIFTALSLGVRSFDAAAGGLGGCPYALGASGNVATEDLVSMLHAMNVSTAISLERLCQASLVIEKTLKKHVPSKLVAMNRATRE
jgi:hydroxymethylglutaryl-CoA lyase